MTLLELATTARLQAPLASKMPAAKLQTPLALKLTEPWGARSGALDASKKETRTTLLHDAA
jgi:hypothetical protein